MPIPHLEQLIGPMRRAGAIAVDQQNTLDYDQRQFKADGSVVTRADHLVEEFLTGEIRRLYPDTNIISEETVRDYQVTRDFTFAIDPVDGTDSFSRGMPGWCVSVGLLDEALTPVGGLVFAPRLGLFFFADVGLEATCNGRRIEVPHPGDPISSKTNIMVYSRIHQHMDMSRFPGKCRNLGSAALHLCCPLIYPGISAAMENRRVHIWDIAGSHAVNISVGLDFELLRGGPVDYAGMVHGEELGGFILAGHPAAVKDLRELVRRLPGPTP
jgi:fructose-1,6-bisphosphatase/inositol monophosphatase family enzyme